MSDNAKLYPHYHKDVTALRSIDVYRVLQLFNVTDPCLQHAIKKLLVAGGRGGKDKSKDVKEAMASLKRFMEIEEEDRAVFDAQMATHLPPYGAAIDAALNRKRVEKEQND